MEQILSPEEVLKRYSGGPQSGIFTDGSARPNPGPGGWGVVYVLEGKIQHQDSGHDPQTTNNRMELTAIINGLKYADPQLDLEMYTDSELCVNTFTKWADSWARNGWRRKSGPIANLDLVQEAYQLLKSRPKVRLKWIKAHNGWLWNEYADCLSTAWVRSAA